MYDHNDDPDDFGSFFFSLDHLMAPVDYNECYVVKIGQLYLTTAGFEGNQKKALRFNKRGADFHTSRIKASRRVKLVKRDYCGAV